MLLNLPVILSRNLLYLATYYSLNFFLQKELLTKIQANLHKENYIQLQITTLNRHKMLSVAKDFFQL